MTSSTLTIDRKAAKLPMKEGAIGPSIIDTSVISAWAGTFTYGPGFALTSPREADFGLRVTHHTVLPDRDDVTRSQRG